MWYSVSVAVLASICIQSDRKFNQLEMLFVALGAGGGFAPLELRHQGK